MTGASAPRPQGRGAQSAKSAARPGSSRERIVPAWLPKAALAICLLGSLVSVYLTIDAFTGGATLACPEGETLNCAKVTESEWSKLFGVPVAPLGLVFFAAMAWLCRPALFRRPGKRWDRLRLTGVGVGLAMVLYLVWAELFKIHAICLWCTVVHVLTFALFLVLLFGQILIEPPPARVRYKDRPR
jgi:uncharacterized membrane protein